MYAIKAVKSQTSRKKWAKMRPLGLCSGDLSRINNYHRREQVGNFLQHVDMRKMTPYPSSRRFIVAPCYFS